MSSPGRASDWWFVTGWGATVVGGVTLIASGFLGAISLSLVGVGVALVGFVVAASRLYPGAAVAAVPEGTEGRGWLEEDLGEELPAPEVDEGPAPVPVSARTSGPVPHPHRPVVPVPGLLAASTAVALPSPGPSRSLDTPATPSPVDAVVPVASSPASPDPETEPEELLAPAEVPEELPAWSEGPAEPVAAAETPALEPVVPAPGPSEAPAATPPMGSSLPFAPAIERSGATVGDPSLLAGYWAGVVPPTVEILAEEVVRLRGELDSYGAPLLVPGLSPMPPAGPVGGHGFVTRVPEPPPEFARGTASRRCGGCGESAPRALEGNYRCWGCGRTLCVGCFWRSAPGPELHRCPACSAGAPAPVMAVSVSGGRRSAPRAARPGVPDELE